MRINILTIGLAVFILQGCSPKYGIEKSYAFRRTITMGNIPVDQNNFPTMSGVQEAHLVFLETTSIAQPAWDTAWIRGNAYSIKHYKIEEEKLNLGRTKDSDIEIKIVADQHNTLWQLLMTPLKQSRYEKETAKKNSIVLSGLWRGKRVYYTIKEETELAPIFGE